MRRIYILLAIILLFSAWLRFWKLGEIPSGHNNDEATYIYTAYSVWHTRQDITGAYLPLSFNIFSSFSPVPIYLMAPFVGILGLSPFSARLPYAILGTGLAFLIFLITKKLLNNDYIALAATFVLAVSPWHIQLSKISYDGPLALFFYSLGTYLFLLKKEKGSILWSLPAYLFGFYSYHGAKVFFIFFIPLLLFIFRDEVGKRRKELFLFIIGILLILLSFFYVFRTPGMVTQKYFLWTDIDNISRIVDKERTVNSAPLILRKMFSNKPLAFLKIIRENYLQAVSPHYLFLSGETGINEKIYGISSRGAMYIIELPLLLLGLVSLFRLKKKIRNFLLFGLLIAPLPSTFVVDQSYGMRSVMMIPFLSMITGLGIYDLWQRLKKTKKVFVYSFIIVFLFFYLFLICEYLYQFYFRYSLYGAESWNRSKRDVVEYIDKVKGNYENVYIANRGELLIQYVLFNKVDPVKAQIAYKSSLPKKIDNVYFVGDCFETKLAPFNPKIYLPQNTLYVAPSDCYEKVTEKPIKTIVEVGEPLHTVWAIFERKE